MNIEWLGGVPEQNFMVGRNGNPVGLIVDHWMAASFDSALARFRDPTQKVSAHFLVGTDGRVAQIVASDDTAYHAGDWDVNEQSIGIEHEASPTLLPSPALYAASAELHRHIAQLYGFTLEVGATVKPHNAIIPTKCPGTLDLERIVANAKETQMRALLGQSPDLRALTTGQVGEIEAVYAYPTLGHPDGITITRKVVASKAGRRVVTVYPPVDPFTDETLDLDSEPALFVVDVLTKT